MQADMTKMLSHITVTQDTECCHRQLGLSPRNSWTLIRLGLQHDIVVLVYTNTGRFAQMVGVMCWDPVSGYSQI